MAASVAGVTRNVITIKFVGDSIRSFRDDNGLCVWVSVKDILSNIGIRISAEQSRLEDIPELIKEMHISLFKTYDSLGRGDVELFIPHSRINRYLFSFPLEMVSSDLIRGNLNTYQDEFLVVLNQEWVRMEGTVPSYNPLELRRAVIESSTADLKREIASLCDSQEDIDRVVVYCMKFLRDIIYCEDKGLGEMSAFELDAYGLLVTLLRGSIRQHFGADKSIEDVIRPALVEAKRFSRSIPSIMHDIDRPQS